MGDPDALSDDGQPMYEQTWQDDINHIFQNINPAFEKGVEVCQNAHFDWVAHTAKHYSKAIVAEAGKWCVNASHRESERIVCHIDPTTLNADQLFIYRAVKEHDSKSSSHTHHICSPPFVAMINGTAGSGKTYLIHALLQLLGDRATAVAPTGVAADNIGGQTYHSLLKLPMKDLDNPDIFTDGKQKSLNKLLRERTPKLEYILFDEMSMVGKRSLGHIDALLRAGTGSDVMFGGLNVIFLGDHGQLPPVKDERGYSWDTCKHMKDGVGCRCRPNQPKCGATHKGDKKTDAKYWHLKGLDAYEHITQNGHVFYLTTIQRCSGTDLVCEQFRQVQMAARGGTLTEDDHTWLFNHCSIKAAQARGELAEFDTATRLVSTRAMRDRINAEDFSNLATAQASIIVKAIDSDIQWLQLPEIHKRLHDTLHLAIGQRVMINWNLTVKHGLVNGTRGNVADVLVNSKGIAVAVILIVKQHGNGTNGYSGPQWPHSTAYGSPPSGHCFVAIGRQDEHCNIGGVLAVCSQFPLMEAAALTVHKAQGLTLDRVIFDPGDDEPRNSVGIFFVGLTRVKHPHHLVLVRGHSHFPNPERLTGINTKPSLISRHNHEVELWSFFMRTCCALAHLTPGPSCKLVPPKWRRPVSQCKDGPRTAKRKAVGSIPHNLSPAKKAPNHPNTGPPSPHKKHKTATTTHITTPSSSTASVSAWRSSTLRHHQSCIALRGMTWPSLQSPFSCSPPSWATQSCSQGMCVYVRVADFYAQPENGIPGLLVKYLSSMVPNLHLVFDTPTSNGCTAQIGVSCGMVAAKCVGIMYLASDSWMTVDLGATTDVAVVQHCNAILNTYQGAPCTTWLLDAGNVEDLVEIFCLCTEGTRSQFCLVSSFDHCLKEVTDYIYNASIMPGLAVPPKWWVCNTDLSTSTGFHWFTFGCQVMWPPIVGAAVGQQVGCHGCHSFVPHSMPLHVEGCLLDFRFWHRPGLR